MEELKNYYANLLIIQYNGKPKASATIKMLVDLIYANMILIQIRDAFDWRTAVGAQLDIIGQWVGVGRDYAGLLYWGKKYLSYPSWNSLVPTNITDNLQHGYSDYATFETDTGNVLTYPEIGIYKQSLDDDDYRVVIGLKIIKNNINCTCKNIDDAIWNYFEGKVYTTWTAHTLTYNYDSSLSTIMNICEYKNVLPAPTGVAIVLREIIS